MLMKSTDKLPSAGFRIRSRPQESVFCVNSSNMVIRAYIPSGLLGKGRACKEMTMPVSADDKLINKHRFFPDPRKVTKYGGHL
jgi:hypothetical protein